MQSVALTDHGSLSGFLKFYKAAKDIGINPILGEEIYVNDSREEIAAQVAAKKEKQKRKKKEDEEEQVDTYSYDPNNHLVLLAKNYDGFRSILKIHADGVRNGFYYRPRTTHEIVKELGKNIVVTTACMAGKAGALIREYKFSECKKFLSEMKEAFGGDFYLELQLLELQDQHLINQKLLEFSKQLKIPFIITNDVHYLLKDDNKIHDIHKMIRGKKTITDDLSKTIFDARELYLKTYSEMLDTAKRFEYDIPIKIIEEGLERTLEIEEKCKNIEVPMGKIHFPKFYPDPKNPDPNFDPEEFLRQKVNEGYRRRLKQGLIPKNEIKKYVERGKYELDVVIRKNYHDYFLIVSDFTDECRKRRIFKGGGRGSAAGSILSWYTGITEVDPIKNGLIFERFLNEDRSDPPDIDLDFDSYRRHEIEEYLIDKYGEEKIAHIISFGKYGEKGIVRDVGRVHNIDYKIVNKIANLMQDGIGIKANVEKILEECNDNEVLEFVEENDEFFKICDRMVGLVRHYGQHAGGTVVTPGPLENYIPIMRVKDKIVTGLQEGGDEREMSDLGILKLDILGLNWCTILRRAIDLVKERHGIDYWDKIWSIDYNDPKLMALFAQADTEDIFQYASKPMRDFIKQVAGSDKDEHKATVEGVKLVFNDLVAINAGWRPAVIMSGATEVLATNKHKDPEEIDYLHPSMKSALEETYAALIYQEQFMRILMDTAGFTAAEADKARKTLKYLNKGKHDTESKSYKEFIQTLNKLQNGWRSRGFTEEQIEELTQILAKFIEYSFNKSHSCSYAQAAVQGMYFKVYYPIEYFTALLQSTESGVKKDSKGRKERDRIPMLEFINIAKKHGIEVLPPRIGKSYSNYIIEDDKIRAGLSIINGCGDKAADSISKGYPINSIEEFFASDKIDWRPAHKGVIEVLIKVGAFDDLYNNRKVLLKAFELWNKYKDKIGKNNIKEKANKFLQYLKKAENEIEDDYTEDEKLEFEKELLGFYFTKHPFDKYSDIINKREFKIPSDIGPKTKTAEVAGIVSSVRTVKTKHKETMAFVDISDINGAKASVTVWPELWKLYKKDLKEGNCIAAKIKRNTGKYSDSFVLNDKKDDKRLVIQLDRLKG